MRRKNNKYYIRKTHRYLGVIIGIQFLFWTISGLYFTWTDIDEIHGDHFIKETDIVNSIDSKELGLSIDSSVVSSMELKFINSEPYLWVNDSKLIHAKTGEVKSEISESEAKKIVRSRVKEEYEIETVEFLESTGPHHEYRGRELPVWQVNFKGNESIAAYVDVKTGDFKTLRHRDWRWFDFLWMSHTMDYEGRDDFNNLLIRVFSLFGLFTVCSGFLLFFVSTKWSHKKLNK
ncbi:hypothetical protein QYS48_31585 [Marivirga arenosa]|uniref:PepSY domain-containing protein n=1 Tax=Marivirga arenosa TaxID=3059076 RepID=A0AA51RC81_9BACT|nr:hypothetical protein [Marivirga sp. ABR2-2]WMN06094.1 hypothetical protein QYS48_31585 [Marivirga sp. ABR2-2]